VVSETAGRTAAPSRFHPASLDALNFLLADVRGALGPYLNVFLVTQQHWSQGGVGLVTAIGGWIGLAVQTPAGALIDATRAKRALIVGALAILAAGAMTIYIAPAFWPVMDADFALLVAGFDFGCSAKYSVGRVDMRNPRRTPITVGNRMFG
jgi:hypothetical protein